MRNENELEVELEVGVKEERCGVKNVKVVR